MCRIKQLINVYFSSQNTAHQHLIHTMSMYTCTMHGMPKSQSKMFHTCSVKPAANSARHSPELFLLLLEVPQAVSDVPELFSRGQSLRAGKGDGAAAAGGVEGRDVRIALRPLHQQNPLQPLPFPVPRRAPSTLPGTAGCAGGAGRGHRHKHLAA